MGCGPQAAVAAEAASGFPPASASGWRVGQRATKPTRSSEVLSFCRWSMNRPGVATTISTPPRRSLRWSPMLAPPTTMEVLNPFSERLKAFNSFSICCASSRVGAMTSASGPSPRRMGVWRRQNWIMGIAKAAVLPDPVSAQPADRRGRR